MKSLFEIPTIDVQNEFSLKAEQEEEDEEEEEEEEETNIMLL